MSSVTRRTFISGAVTAAGASAVLISHSARALSKTAATGKAIPALLPRDAYGHQFVLFSDCTVVDEKEARYAQALRSIGAVIQRLAPQPEFIAFPGDAVGTGADGAEWEFFLEQVRWARQRGIPLYQSTSNHNAHNFLSEANFRKYNPNLPLNGPADEKGLAYWIRRGNLLYVSVHHPAPNAQYRPGFNFGDMTWVDEVLTQNADAEYKLVAGHYPVFRINGYTGMSIPHEAWEPFWATLRQHRVDAYLASHVLAFDVQIRDGILQICSGGAGPDVMPAATEGTHAVQIALDRQGMRYQVLNLEGAVRESLVWPFLPPEDTTSKDSKWTVMEAGQPLTFEKAPEPPIALYRISGLTYFPNPHEHRVEIFVGTREGARTLQVWMDHL